VPKNARGYRARPRPIQNKTAAPNAPRHITSAELEADPDFAAQLKNMLAEYEKAAKAHAAATGVSHAELHGDGALAHGTRAAAASSGGTAISGDVGGDVHLGGQDKPKGR
jgi:hypothetical protein